MEPAGIEQEQVEDIIPYTNLNICHKNKTDHKRCFVFGYQVAIHITDRNPWMIPKLYAKINFNGFDKKMLILPGDTVGVRFESVAQAYEAMRLQPDIHSNDLPEPFRTRYNP